MKKVSGNTPLEALKPQAEDQKMDVLRRNEGDGKCYISLKVMEDFCMRCVKWEDARPIVDFMEKHYGPRPPKEVRQRIRRIKRKFTERIYDCKIKADRVVMNHPKVKGPLNSFRGNRRINIGK
jgi:hypothetical protein